MRQLLGLQTTALGTLGSIAPELSANVHRSTGENVGDARVALEPDLGGARKLGVARGGGEIAIAPRAVGRTETLAHEAIHLVQQRRSVAGEAPASGVNVEAEARSGAAAVLAGRPFEVAGRTTAPQNQDECEAQDSDLQMSLNGPGEDAASHGETIEQTGAGSCNVGDATSLEADAAYERVSEQVRELISQEQTAALEALSAAYQAPLEWEKRLAKQAGERFDLVEKRHVEDRVAIQRYYARLAEQLRQVATIHSCQLEASLASPDHVRLRHSQIADLEELVPRLPEPLASLGRETPLVEQLADEAGRPIEVCHPFWGDGPISLPPLYLSDEGEADGPRPESFEVEGFTSSEDTLRARAATGDKEAAKSIGAVDDARAWKHPSPTADDDPYDLAVRAVGKKFASRYKNWQEGGWAAFQAEFDVVDFLGHQVPGHRLLLERLDVATRFMQSRHPGLSPAEIGTELGIERMSGQIRLGKESSYHSLGLSVDIDSHRNPWIAGERADSSDLETLRKVAEANVNAVIAIWHAVWLTGQGTPYSPAEAAKWVSEKTSTPEIFQRLIGASKALESYMALSEQAGMEESEAAKRITTFLEHAKAPAVPSLATPRTSKNAEADAIIATAIELGRKKMTEDRALLDPTGSSISELVPLWREAIREDHLALYETDSAGAGWGVTSDADGNLTEPAVKGKGFLALRESLVVALRDAAELGWGAVDFGDVQSGDMMHFDCRNVPEASLLMSYIKDPATAKKDLGKGG